MKSIGTVLGVEEKKDALTPQEIGDTWEAAIDRWWLKRITPEALTDMKEKKEDGAPWAVKAWRTAEQLVGKRYQPEQSPYWVP